jgi:hypothetical protein
VVVKNLIVKSLVFGGKKFGGKRKIAFIGSCGVVVVF